MKRRDFLKAAGLASAAAIPGLGWAAEGSYAPGHWVSLFPKQDSQAIMADLLARAPHIKGFLKRWYWSDLEAGATAATATYRLAGIQSDLDWCWARGLRLIVMIQDKTFVMENPLPQYLAHKAVPNRGRGYTSLRWDPVVAARMTRLLVQISSRFKNHSAFEGLGAEETAPSLTAAQLDSFDYTPTRYLDTYVSQIKSVAAAAPGVRSFWHFNYVPRGTNPAEYVVSRTPGCPRVVGGPDCWPNDETLRRVSYPQYPKVADRVPTSIVMSQYSYEQLNPDGTYMSMQKVFDFARTNLRISYAFWAPMGQPYTSKKNRFADAAVVMSNTRAWTGV